MVVGSANKALCAALHDLRHCLRYPLPEVTSRRRRRRRRRLGKAGLGRGRGLVVGVGALQALQGLCAALQDLRHCLRYPLLEVLPEEEE